MMALSSTNMAGIMYGSGLRNRMINSYLKNAQTELVSTGAATIITNQQRQQLRK